MNSGELNGAGKFFAKENCDKLTRIRKMFLEALDGAAVNYREGGAVEGDVRNEIKVDINGNKFVEVNDKLFDAKSGESHAQTIARIIKDRFDNLISVNGQQIQINATTNREWRRSESASHLSKIAPDLYDDKLKSIPYADEIIKVAKNWIGEELSHPRKDDIIEFARGTVYYRVNSNGYVADVLVGIRRNGGAVLYDLKNIYQKNITDAPLAMARKNSQRSEDTSVKDNITQSNGNVKNQNRVYLEAVEKGDIATAQKLVDEAANKAMPNSLIKDENGKLLTVYHGSPGRFTVFRHHKMNINGNAHGRGFYFTEEKAMAEGYQKEGGQLLKGVLNITKPLSEEKVTIKKNELKRLVKATCERQAESFVDDGGYDNVEDAIFDTWISNYVYTYGMDIEDAYSEVTNIIFDNVNDVDIVAEISNVVGSEIALKATYEVLGFDGVIYKNERGTHEYVSLISNQFKSTDAVTYDENGNVIPLSERFNSDNSDIRYSKKVDIANKRLTKGKGKRYNNNSKSIKLSSREYALVSKAVMAYNTRFGKEDILKPIIGVNANDNYYVCANDEFGKFSVLARYDSENEVEIIKQIREVLRNEINSISEFTALYAESDVAEWGDNRRRNNLRISGTENRRRSEGNGGLYAEKSQYNQLRDFGKSNSELDDVKNSLPINDFESLHRSNIEKVTELGKVTAQMQAHILRIGSNLTKRELSALKIQEIARKLKVDYASKLDIPDEKSRRVGQSVAAASLPEIR